MFTFFQAQVVYYQRHQDYERCREALRIAEQGAEIGATGENKVEKRKRLEEEVLYNCIYITLTSTLDYVLKYRNSHRWCR